MNIRFKLGVDDTSITHFLSELSLDVWPVQGIVRCWKNEKNNRSSSTLICILEALK